MSIRGFHLFVCDGDKSDVVPCMCSEVRCTSLLDYVSQVVEERGLNAEVSCAGCCQDCSASCKKGPVMLVHPHGWWYGGLDETKVDDILDALTQNRVVDEYLVN